MGNTLHAQGNETNVPCPVLPERTESIAAVILHNWSHRHNRQHQLGQWSGCRTAMLPSVGIVTVVTLWRNHMRSAEQVDATACRGSPAKKSSSLGASVITLKTSMLGHCDLTKVMVTGTSALADKSQTHPGCSADSRNTSKERLSVTLIGVPGWPDFGSRLATSSVCQSPYSHRTVTVLGMFFFFFFFSRHISSQFCSTSTHISLYLADCHQGCTTTVLTSKSKLHCAVLFSTTALMQISFSCRLASAHQCCTSCNCS